MEKLTFESISARAVLVPLKRPIVAKVGAFTEWPLILIDVTTKEGIVGRSYLEPYIKDSAKYIIPALYDMGEKFKGRQICPADMYREIISSLHLIGRQGVSVIVAAGLDMSLWDALAKSVNLPLAQLLGGSTGELRTYNTNGLWLLPLDELADQAQELIGDGDFKAIKMRLGRDRLKDDIQAIKNVRDAIGEDTHIMVDFNQGQTIQEAITRLHGLDDQGIYWFEEPIVYDNYALNAQLAAEIRTPLSIGENIYGPRSFLEAIQAKAADLYMPDLMRIGGVTGWMSAAAIAGAAGAPLSSHLYKEVSAHLLKASESADWLEYSDWGNPVIKEPFEVKNGMAIVPDRIGNGIDWDEDAVKKYQYI